jgi:hypothetical protein
VVEQAGQRALRQMARLASCKPGGHEAARQRESRQDRCQDADGQRHGKAADGFAADEEQDDGGDEDRDIGIDDSGEGAREAALDRLGEGGMRYPLLFTNALIDQHVGIHRHADDQHKAGNARKCKGRTGNA